ncbi:GTP cyclohydrolase II (plasmid) [Ligilactobacillus acidipiscis]|nr:GTP cyclohydrolase II [Ligilactobacillus acidipiscis]
MTQKIEDALEHLKAGGIVIVADSTEREAEGDMVSLAEKATPTTVNTMVTKARGLLCVPLSSEYAQRLHLNPMIENSNDAFGTAFTVSLDAKTTSTGISAYDRARTIKQLADPNSSWDDFYHPGHVFPLIAKKNGVFDRGGHTEAAIDLAKLAGTKPVAFICEILKKDGHMARRKDLKALAEGLGFPFLTIAEIATYRKQKENNLIPITKVTLPTKYGNFNLEAFQNENPSTPTLLISKGNLAQNDPLLVRLHSECLTGDILGSKRCDCGEQLAASLRKINQAGRGAVLYLRQEGRGIGLSNKLKAYKLQEQGLDTVEANTHLGLPVDSRNYALAAQILHYIGVHRVRLMTNNPDKINQLEAHGIEVVERVPLETGLSAENKKYLLTKKHKMNHLLSEVN